MLPLRLTCCVFVAVVTVVACSDPPLKEIRRAEVAIDAAREAGADRYAPETYGDAVQMLADSETAVDQRDYRLALSHALEAHRKAQEASETAVTERSAQKRAAELELAAVDAAVTELTATLAAAGTAHLAAARIAASQRAVRSAEKSLQEARAAISSEDYGGAQEALTGVAASLRKVTTELDGRNTPRSSPAHR